MTSLSSLFDVSNVILRVIAEMQSYKTEKTYKKRYIVMMIVVVVESCCLFCPFFFYIFPF